MKDQFIVKFAICLAYYHLGGFATTNMLRLLKGAKYSVLHNKCYCDACGQKLSVLGQLPILSFFAYRGRCKFCGTPIPRGGLALEIVVFSGMTGISAGFSFSPIGVVLSFLFYELLKISLVIYYGRRDCFLKQYLISVLMSSLMLIFVLFMSLLLKQL